MLTGLKEILSLAKDGNYAVPAFNVYNMESVIGVVNAAEKLSAPVILQIYSRLFDGVNGEYLSEIIKKAAEKTKVPVCFHLDHGAGIKQVIRALRYGATGIMLDVSTLPLEENIRETKQIVLYCGYAGVAAEGELGHIGSVNDKEIGSYTDADEAARFAEETGVAALAVMVGTAHGRYKKEPVLAVQRIMEIKQKTGLPLVLHGGSGVPDNQIKEAIKAGIRKINFGTDLCCAFIEGIAESDPEKYALDLFMNKSVEKIESFATEKIKLLGAQNGI